MSFKKMNTSKSTVRITVLFNMCKKDYFKGTSCKTIEGKFILKQKCLAEGGRIWYNDSNQREFSVCQKNIVGL